MAVSASVPEDVLKDVARQVGDRIAEEFSSLAAATPPAPVNGVAQTFDYWPLTGLDPATAKFKLGETFEVWKLKEDAAAALAGATGDLVTLTRWTGAYRHQIRLVRDGADEAVGFALSYAAGAGHAGRYVRDFFFSRLAAEMDKAIELADQLVPEDAVTRLLSLPEFRVEALWFVKPVAAGAAGPPLGIETRGVIVALAPDRFPGQTMTLTDSATFISVLSNTVGRGMGLLL
jgi:hypothetical protein